MVYILAFIIASCLASGQALWASTVKSIAANNSDIGALDFLTKVILTQKFWFGALLYVLGTSTYLLLLSKAKFFSIQFGMTGIVLIISLIISVYFFQEKISQLNIMGIVLVFLGIFFIMKP